MKKICFVAEYMYCGGTEKSLLSLLNYLDRTKYEITLLLMKKKGDLMSQVPADIKVDEIPFPEDEADDLLNGRNTALKNAIKSGHLLKAAGKALRGVCMAVKTSTGAEKRLWYYSSIEKKLADYPEEFDVVIDYMGYGLFNTFYAARKVKGKKKISWIHFEAENAMPDFVAFRSLLSEYDHIMCVSESCKIQIKNMMPELSDKCQTFYNIVDVKSLRKLAESEKIEKNNGEISIVSIGRLDPQKGFDVGIKVVARLYSEGYPIKWYIIGEGWQRKDLEMQIAKREASQKSVELVGQKLNPYSYIDMCDIYFQPSRHEGYCIALAEAKAFDKPIVATDFAGAIEQLTDGVTGLITDCSVDSLYSALKKLLDNEELRKQLAQHLSEQHEAFPKQIRILESIIDGA